MWNRKSCCARDRPSHSDGDGKSTRLQGISTASHMLFFCNFSQGRSVFRRLQKKWRLNISLHAMELWGFLLLMHIRKYRNFSKRLFLSPQQPVVACEEAQTVLVVKYYISGLRDWNSLSMTEEFVHFYWM
ncbi:unnamed protein product [Sphagnum troendelagicum]